MAPEAVAPMKPVMTGTLRLRISGKSLVRHRSRVTSKSGRAAWNVASVRMISIARTASAAQPLSRKCAAIRCMQMRSPSEEIASKARGEASPSTSTAWHRARNSPMWVAMRSFTSDCSAAVVSSAATVSACLACSVVARSCQPFSPREAMSAPSSRRFVTPLMAETTTATCVPLACSARTRRAAARSASALPTDVPPNFIMLSVVMRLLPRMPFGRACVRLCE